MISKMAESERFELSIQRSPYTRFPGVLLQPLGQLSTMLYLKSYLIVTDEQSFRLPLSFSDKNYYTHIIHVCQHFFLKKIPKITKPAPA